MRTDDVDPIWIGGGPRVGYSWETRGTVEGYDRAGRLPATIRREGLSKTAWDRTTRIVRTFVRLVQTDFSIANLSTVE